MLSKFALRKFVILGHIYYSKSLEPKREFQANIFHTCDSSSSANSFQVFVR
jgi:hypothetical protein